MFWSFAIINNKLAEIFFEKTKQEQKWIRQDTEKNRFIYRNGKYKLK